MFSIINKAKNRSKIEIKVLGRVELPLLNLYDLSDIMNMLDYFTMYLLHINKVGIGDY